MSTDQHAMMLTELGKFMEEMLSTGMKPVSDIGELLGRTPFQAAWRREPKGLSNLLREIPNVELCENPEGILSARLIVLPEVDPYIMKSIYVDGSHIDVGPGFGGWAALLPGGKNTASPLDSQETERRTVGRLNEECRKVTVL